MKSENLILVLLIIFGVLGLSAGAYFLLQPRSNENKEIDVSDVVEIPDEPQKGDPGYQETDTELVANESSRYSGTYAGISEGEFNLNYRNTNIISYALSDSEIALECTEQPLANVQSVDAEDVRDIKLTNAASLEEKLINGDPVFVLATEGEGKPVVHTIFVGTDVCERFN